MARPTLPPRPPIILGAIAHIPLTKGLFAIVDVEDLPLVGDRVWTAGNISANGTAYAVSHRNRNGKEANTMMHRVILGVVDESVHIDHINHNRLDNRRANLRVCKPVDNLRNLPKFKSNSSGYKGVTRSTSGKWRARIGDRGRITIGVFDCPEQAAMEYDKAAVAMYGEFACTNASLGLLRNFDGV